MKPLKTAYRRAKGFGLMEVLLATVVLGIGVVGIAQFQGNVYKGGSISKQRAEALKIAEQKLEELRHFSTATDYEQQITSSLSGTNTLANTTINDRSTTVYSLKAYAIPGSAGRSATLSVEVSWPDQTAEGAVTPSTTIQLSTVVSNTTPNALTMTAIAPGPLPSTDADSPPVPVLEDPEDTSNLTSSNPEACACAPIVAANTPNTPGAMDSSGFIKVMMKRSGVSSSTVTTSTLTTEYCDICCNYAIPGTQTASLENNEHYYADFKKKLDAFLKNEIEAYQKTSMEDRSIAENQFNPAYLIKGYQSTESLYEKFLQKTMMGKNGNQNTSATQWALCSFVTVTTTTSTVTRGCKVWAKSP